MNEKNKKEPTKDPISEILKEIEGFVKVARQISETDAFKNFAGRVSSLYEQKFKNIQPKEITTDMINETDRILIVVELAGCKKDDIKIELSPDLVSIHAVKTVGKTEIIERTFTLPDEKYDFDTAKATLMHGVLEISIPKILESNELEVAIKTLKGSVKEKEHG